MKVALIGCGRRKRRGRWRVRDLYISNRFQMTLRYCLLVYDAVYVLSAKHGLIGLDCLVDEYDTTLGQMSKVERERWSTKVTRQINRTIPIDAELHFYCGKPYRQGLEHVREYVSVPLHGMRIGKQLSWLRGELSRILVKY